MTVGAINLTKTVLTPKAGCAIGETMTYEVVIDLPPGVSLANSVAADVLDLGLTYVTGTLSVSKDSASTSQNPTNFTRTDGAPGAGQETLSLGLGTLTNTTSAIAGITLTYQARVEQHHREPGQRGARRYRLAHVRRSTWRWKRRRSRTLPWSRWENPSSPWIRPSTSQQRGWTLATA